MHEKKSAAPFFIPFFLPSSAAKEKNRWRDTKRPSVMFALAGKQALRLHAARLTWAPVHPSPRGPLNAPPTLVVSTPLLHITSDRAGISLSQQVCVVLCSILARNLYCWDESHFSRAHQTTTAPKRFSAKTFRRQANYTFPSNDIFPHLHWSEIPCKPAKSSLLLQWECVNSAFTPMTPLTDASFTIGLLMFGLEFKASLFFPHRFTLCWAAGQPGQVTLIVGQSKISH